MRPSETCLDHPRRYAAWTELWVRGIAVFGRLYCQYFHAAISRPVNGKYRCWRCLREYELEWKV